jgi:hypothetical protein
MTDLLYPIYKSIYLGDNKNSLNQNCDKMGDMIYDNCDITREEGFDPCCIQQCKKWKKNNPKNYSCNFDCVNECKDLPAAGQERDGGVIPLPTPFPSPAPPSPVPPPFPIPSPDPPSPKKKKTDPPPHGTPPKGHGFKNKGNGLDDENDVWNDETLITLEKTFLKSIDADKQVVRCLVRNLVNKYKPSDFKGSNPPAMEDIKELMISCASNQSYNLSKDGKICIHPTDCESGVCRDYKCIGSKLSTGVIIGIVVGVLVLIVVMYLIFKPKGGDSTEFSSSDSSL